MKVFLSWSGTLSHSVASALRDWLPSVLQSVQPYVSSEDIDKGARWSSDIAQELEASSYGVVVLTQENTEAPWIAFEAGALSKALDKSRVSPFLVNLKRSEVQGPLVQFQFTVYEKEDLLKLVASINKSAPEAEQLDLPRLQKVFDVWWPELQKELDALLASAPQPQPKQKKKATADDNPILEEILELVRGQQRILSDPSELLPPRYLSDVLRHESGRHRPDLDPDAWVFLQDHYAALKKHLTVILAKERPSLNKEERSAVAEELERLDGVMTYMRRHMRTYLRRNPQLRMSGISMG